MLPEPVPQVKWAGSFQKGGEVVVQWRAGNPKFGVGDVVEGKVVSYCTLSVRKKKKQQGFLAAVSRVGAGQQISGAG